LHAGRQPSLMAGGFEFLISPFGFISDFDIRIFLPVSS
jgi:hypothetical protein